jgi:hypothetical protein
MRVHSACVGIFSPNMVRQNVCAYISRYVWRDFFCHHEVHANLVTLVVLEAGLTWLKYSHFPMKTTVFVLGKHRTKRIVSIYYGLFKDSTQTFGRILV